MCALVALGLTACGGGAPGVEYPQGLPPIDALLVTPENAPGASVSLGSFKIGAAACQDVDARPVTRTLTANDFTSFLAAHGAAVTPTKARENLYFYDFPTGNPPPSNVVRLRLAILDDAPAAAGDLRDSVLSNGSGWWGVRRSNLAVLAPKTALHDALAFALKYKLPCWGIFTVAHGGDAVVVPGPYGEL